MKMLIYNMEKNKCTVHIYLPPLQISLIRIGCSRLGGNYLNLWYLGSCVFCVIDMCGVTLPRLIEAFKAPRKKCVDPMSLARDFKKPPNDLK